MVLLAYGHGLRASELELVDLRWDQVDFRTATLHVRRVKHGTPATHPILGRALRRLQREQEPKSPSVLTSERGAPFTSAATRSRIRMIRCGLRSSASGDDQRRRQASRAGAGVSERKASPGRLGGRLW
jgi:integrase